MRPLFIVAIVGLVIALGLVVLAFSHHTTHPIWFAGWVAMTMHGQLLLARDRHTAGAPPIFWIIPLGVLSLPLMLPFAVWVIVASHQQYRTRGFPIEPKGEF